MRKVTFKARWTLGRESQQALLGASHLLWRARGANYCGTHNVTVYLLVASLSWTWAESAPSLIIKEVK